MIVIKSKIQKYFVATYKDLFLHVHMMVENKDCDKYLRFSIYSHCSNNYYDMYFKYDDAPLYIQTLYTHIEENTRLSIQDDFIITLGPSLDKKILHKVSCVHLFDYDMMISRDTEFVYNEEASLMFAATSLKPIYDDIISEA
jgi:hypothetical protein